jgi:hypothetical protein
MGRFNNRGQKKVYWAPTITTLSAPTVAQVVTAGKNLTPVIRAITGFKFGAGTEDAADMDSRFPKNVPGMQTLEDSTITIYEGDDAADVEKVVELLLVNDLAGYIVFVPSGVFTATKKCRVWPVKVLSNSPDESADSGAATVTLGFALTAVPSLYATCTA